MENTNQNKKKTMLDIDDSTSFKLVCELYNYKPSICQTAWVLLAMNLGLYKEFSLHTKISILDAQDGRVPLCILFRFMRMKVISQIDYCDAVVNVFDKDVLGLEMHSKLEQRK